MCVVFVAWWLLGLVNYKKYFSNNKNNEFGFILLLNMGVKLSKHILILPNLTYRVIGNERENVNSTFLLMKTSKKYFIILPAFYPTI